MPAMIGRVRSLPPWPEPPPDTTAQVLLAVAATLPLWASGFARLFGFGEVGQLLALLAAAAVSLWVLLARRRRLRRKQKPPPRPDLVDAVFVSEPSNLDELLPARFATADAVDGLLDLGNLAVFGADVLVAYTRDQGEPWANNQAQVYDANGFRRCPPLVGQARLWYLFDGRRWWVKDGRDREDSWQARRAPWRELYGSRSVSGAGDRTAGDRPGD